MGTANNRDEFKPDAVQQIKVRGDRDREVWWRWGCVAHSLRLDEAVRGICPWGSAVDHEAENRRRGWELALVTEARDILKSASHGPPLVRG